MPSPVNPAEAVAIAETIKAHLIQVGIIPNPQQTNEHAFEITGRLAYALRDRGAKLIRKNAGQNGANTAHGRVSHDAIAFPQGYVDALVGAGPPNNTNRPAWQWTDGPMGSPDAYLDPWDMDAGTVVPTEPTEPTEPDNPEPDTPVETVPLAAILATIHAAVTTSVAGATEQMAADIAEVKRVQAQGLGGMFIGYKIRLKP